MSNKTMLGDASGRGAVDGFRVTCPAMQHPYTEAEIDAVVKVMREACGQTQGKYMVEFEQAFCAFTGAKHAFAVNNCTSALKMAAIFCHIQPGDEVIIPAYTFCASAITFGDLGAKIVWADINPDTWSIDPDDIARKITPKTKAVVCVHLLGMPCDMKKIVPIARAHGLKVVEDCAQALDCRIDGQHVGTFGDFGCFSFHSELLSKIYKCRFGRIPYLLPASVARVVAKYTEQQQLLLSDIIQIYVSRSNAPSINIIILYSHFVLRQRTRFI